MPSTLLTDIGEAKLAAAAGSDSFVAITHIAMGDGGGANYDPAYDQTALVNERARMAIESRIQIAPRQWKVKAEFPPETDAFAVREIGYFDGDGNLISVWAGLDVESRSTGVVSYLNEHVLDFSRVADGLVIVNAPDDAFFVHAITNLETHAITADEQVKQRLLFRDTGAAA